jgi:hypothetical protein
MPEAQADFDAWLKNFSTRISAGPERHNRSEANAAIIAEVFAEWSAAYRPVTAPVSKTKVTVAAKNAAREMAEATIGGRARPASHLVQSSIRRPGTLPKSARFRESSVASRASSS